MKESKTLSYKKTRNITKKNKDIADNCNNDNNDDCIMISDIIEHEIKQKKPPQKKIISFKFICPNCQTKIEEKIEQSIVGVKDLTVQCPKCKRKFVIG
ncbi:MAG: MJ0042-type zinc finger domain-containing protein [Promethearchaeota archaeon]